MKKMNKKTKIFVEVLILKEEKKLLNH